MNVLLTRASVGESRRPSTNSCCGRGRKRVTWMRAHFAPLPARCERARCVRRCRSDRRHNHTTPRPRHARPPVWRACASMAPTGTQTARDDVLRTLVLRECACDGDGHRTARISDADVAEDSVRRRVTVTRGRVARRRARARHGARDSAPVPTYAHRSTRSPHSSSGPAEKGVLRRPKTSCCLELLDFAASVRHTSGGVIKNKAYCV